MTKMEAIEAVQDILIESDAVMLISAVVAALEGQAEIARDDKNHAGAEWLQYAAAHVAELLRD